jgi:hypothetical protein
MFGTPARADDGEPIAGISEADFGKAPLATVLAKDAMAAFPKESAIERSGSSGRLGPVACRSEVIEKSTLQSSMGIPAALGTVPVRASIRSQQHRKQSAR